MKWKEIEQYEGKYLISDTGLVKSLLKNKEIILLSSLNTFGYPKVGLFKDGKYKTIPIHRLVAQYFIPNPNNLKTVNHKDGNKLNNNVENLEWMSQKDNTIHSWKKGLSKPQNGETNGKSKFTNNQILEIRKDNRKLADIAKDYNTTAPTISCIKNFKTWKHLH